MRGTARVFVLDPLKRIKQIPSILTAKSQKNYSISNFFFFFYFACDARILKKLSNVSKFPTTPSCGRARQVLHSHLLKGSEGLHHGDEGVRRW